VRRNVATPLIFIVVVAVGAFVATLASGNTPQLGLDLQGGFSVVLTAKGNVASDSVDKAKDIIRQRIDGLGVAEPEVTRQGKDVIVELPGVKDRTKAQRIVGQTAKLEFRPVLQQAPPGYTYKPADPKTGSTGSCVKSEDKSTTTTTGSSTTTTAPGGSTTATTATTASTTTSTTAPTTTTAPGATTTTTTAPDRSNTTEVVPTAESKDASPICLMLGPVGFEGDALSGARAELDTTNGSWKVSVSVKGGSKAKANALFNACFSGDTTCPTKQTAIVLDNRVQSFPTVQAQNLADTPPFQITGDFSQSEAKDLALVLRYGALPVEFTRSAEQQVSATLGKASLNAGLAAGIVGLILVALYMLLYYRGLGVVVILGMAIWSALMYSVICYLSAKSGLALSLAGVTGIIVSVGTTVDSYVVYFERLKDEVKAGKSLRSSTERGFQRAFRTILTADVSSFIGAFLLWWLTVGPVRGFAFFLGLSVVLDIVVAYFFTRPLVTILGRNKFFTESRFFGVARGLGQQTLPAGGEA
jgi:preprotein translocase subunit SecD